MLGASALHRQCVSESYCWTSTQNFTAESTCCRGVLPRLTVLLPVQLRKQHASHLPTYQLCASTWTTPVDSRLSPSVLRHSSNSSLITSHHVPAVNNIATVEWRRCTLQVRALWSIGSRAIINIGHHIVHDTALASHFTIMRAVISSLRACHFAHAVPCWR